MKFKSNSVLTVLAGALLVLNPIKSAWPQGQSSSAVSTVQQESVSPYQGGYAQGRKDALALRAKGVYEWLVAGPPPTPAMDQALHEVYGRYGIRIRYVGDVLYPGMDEYMTAFMKVMDDALIKRHGKAFPDQLDAAFQKRHAELAAKPLTVTKSR
jgi:hypothetical protein